MDLAVRTKPRRWCMARDVSGTSVPAKSKVTELLESPRQRSVIRDREIDLKYLCQTT